jgi:hypothetical protein
MRTAISPRGVPMSCALCGTRDYDALHVHELGIAVGMSGDDYSFCKSCWNAGDFGDQLLNMLQFRTGRGLKFQRRTITVTGTKDRGPQ